MELICKNCGGGVFTKRTLKATIKKTILRRKCSNCGTQIIENIINIREKEITILDYNNRGKKIENRRPIHLFGGFFASVLDKINFIEIPPEQPEVEEAEEEYYEEDYYQEDEEYTEDEEEVCF